MVSQCANPDCGAPFLYLRRGRRRGLPARQWRVEYFWRCGNCAGKRGSTYSTAVACSDFTPCRNPDHLGSAALGEVRA